MNTEHQHPREARPEPPPAEEAERAEASTATTAPEAIQAADVDREQGEKQGLDTDRPARGVDWVRPSDLISRAGGVLSRRGIDFQEHLSRRTRTGIATGAKHVVAYAKRLPSLPPLSAFGHHEEPAPEGRTLGRG